MAPSTIGLTVYNVLTIAPRPLSASELYESASRHLGVHIEKSDFVEAMKTLVHRKLLFVQLSERDHKQDLFSCYDERRRRVRWRDRSGDGWNGWMAENHDGGGPIPIEVMIKEQALQRIRKGV
jgi:hypothetical protein